MGWASTQRLRRGAGAAILLAVLVVALALVWGAPASAKSGSVLPKGTPYAAEVTAHIVGSVDISYSDDDTTYSVCEEQSAESKISEGFGFDWGVSYPHVTVPVADAEQLGKADKRLHVDAQPTSNGVGGLLNSNYTITGSEPATNGGNQGAGGSDCQPIAYNGSGTFQDDGKPTFALEDFNHIWGLSHTFVFVMPAIQATPATYSEPTGGSDSVYDDLTDVTDTIPMSANTLQSQPSWATVPADFDITKLRQLIHSSSVTLPVSYSSTYDCSDNVDPSTGSDSCSVTWHYKWTVKLVKKFLYRTKRAYAR
jgi:hypothetical protein